MLRKCLLSTVVLAAASVPAFGQDITSDQLVVGTEVVETSQISIPEGEEAKALTSNCSGGIVYDDNGFNIAYAVGSGQARIVMKIDLPPGTTSLDQACICLTRNSSAPSSVPFNIVVYNDNGGGGGPGTLIATTTAVTATSIPVFPSVGFYNVNLTGSGLVLPDTSVYVGAAWQADNPSGPIFMCGDTSTTTTQRTSYGSGNGGASFTNMATLFQPPTSTPPRAMGIRVDPTTGGGGLCVPSATAMCLNNNRFKVEARFATGDAALNNAQVVKLTDDTGYLWFFSSTNVELVVKVLNACNPFGGNKYWVFAAGLTNTYVELKVTDTSTGAIKTYENPLNQAYQPLQDTSAFATCP